MFLIVWAAFGVNFATGNPTPGPTSNPTGNPTPGLGAPTPGPDKVSKIGGCTPPTGASLRTFGDNLTVAECANQCYDFTRGSPITVTYCETEPGEDRTTSCSAYNVSVLGTAVVKDCTIFAVVDGVCTDYSTFDSFPDISIGYGCNTVYTENAIERSYTWIRDAPVSIYRVKDALQITPQIAKLYKTGEDCNCTAANKCNKGNIITRSMTACVEACAKTPGCNYASYRETSEQENLCTFFSECPDGVANAEFNVYKLSATPEPTGTPTPVPTQNPTSGSLSNHTPGPTGNPSPGPTGNPTPEPVGTDIFAIANGRCTHKKNTVTLPTWSHKDGSVALCAQDCLNYNGTNVLPTMATYCKVDVDTNGCDQSSQTAAMGAHTSCTHFAFVDNVCTDYSWFAYFTADSEDGIMEPGAACNSLTAIDGKAASFRWTDSPKNVDNVYVVLFKSGAIPILASLVADNAATLAGYCSAPTVQLGTGILGYMACRHLAISKGTGDLVHYGWDVVGGVCNDYSTAYTKALCENQGNGTRKWVTDKHNLYIRVASLPPPTHGPSPPPPSGSGIAPVTAASTTTATPPPPPPLPPGSGITPVTAASTTTSGITNPPPGTLPVPNGTSTSATRHVTGSSKTMNTVIEISAAVIVLIIFTAGGFILTRKSGQNLNLDESKIAFL